MKRENGLVFASYLIWGLLPIFWKQLSMVNSAYVLASRIIWSAISQTMSLACSFM